MVLIDFPKINTDQWAVFKAGDAPTVRLSPYYETRAEAKTFNARIMGAGKVWHYSPEPENKRVSYELD